MRSLFSRACMAPFLVGLLATPILAQGPQVAPIGSQPTATTQGTSNVVAVPAYQPPPIVNVNGYPPGGYGYYPSNPYGGYLSGRADLVTARSQAAVTQQQAALVQQQAYNAQLQSRRAIMDEARYERETSINSEQMRLKSINDDLRRARNDPPLNEIWSGDSLNALLTDVKNAHTYGVRGPVVPIDQAILKHINLTTGVTSGSLGVLKDGPKLRWPTVLLNNSFDDDRKQLDVRIEAALQQAKAGPVQTTMISDLKATIQRMQDTLKSVVAQVPPDQYIDAKKYLRELDSSVSTLKDPNVANYFNGMWVAQGATVYDLTDYMTKNGLKFAPAVAADQPFYTMLYQSLVTYDVRMAQTVSR